MCWMCVLSSLFFLKTQCGVHVNNKKTEMRPIWRLPNLAGPHFGSARGGAAGGCGEGAGGSAALAFAFTRGLGFAGSKPAQKPTSTSFFAPTTIKKMSSDRFLENMKICPVIDSLQNQLGKIKHTLLQTEVQASVGYVGAHTSIWDPLMQILRGVHVH